MLKRLDASPFRLMVKRPPLRGSIGEGRSCKRPLLKRPASASASDCVVFANANHVLCSYYAGDILPLWSAGLGRIGQGLRTLLAHIVFRPPGVWRLTGLNHDTQAVHEMWEKFVDEASGLGSSQ